MEKQEQLGIDLLEVLGTITPLSAAYQERLRQKLLVEHYPAKHLLLKPGEISRHIYFISAGLVRIYSTDDTGKERTIFFMGPGEIVLDVSSFYEQTPATEFLETLQPTTMQTLSWHQLNSFYADFREGNYIGRIVTEKYLILAVDRINELVGSNAHDRYLSLLNKFPEIEQQASQSHIASYLGITRETLCRLKSEQVRS